MVTKTNPLLVALGSPSLTHSAESCVHFPSGPLKRKNESGATVCSRGDYLTFLGHFF